MRGVENDAGAGAVKFDDDIFHLKAAENRRAMKIVLFDRAAEAFELANDVGLSAVNSLGRRRPRADLHETADMLDKRECHQMSQVNRRRDASLAQVVKPPKRTP